MATTAQLVNEALDALTPEAGYHEPNSKQIREADVRARIATASALSRIAGALETLAVNTAPDTTVQAPIRHNA